MTDEPEQWEPWHKARYSMGPTTTWLINTESDRRVANFLSDEDADRIIADHALARDAVEALRYVEKTLAMPLKDMHNYGDHGFHFSTCAACVLLKGVRESLANLSRISSHEGKESSRENRI